MPGLGLIIAAPSSGAGKTTVTLGLLRALTRQGVAVRGAKSGPDYIDPKFHEAACGAPCVNLDAWAMRPPRLQSLASGKDLLVVEGAMGLFDGAPPDAKGATADLARILGLPVLLVVDAARLSHSVAPLVAGFAVFDPEVRVAGVILNRVGSERHETMLRTALQPLGIPVLGAIPRAADLALPSRHLGLVQAEEHADLERFLEAAADRVLGAVDVAGVRALAAPVEAASAAPEARERVGRPQRIAIARDPAFTFLYPHQLAAWRHGGAEVTFFSPLADEAVPDADMVFLPGGYPELHAARLAAASTFLESLRFASQGAEIYGECGGYMVLGETLIDAAGQAHKMAGLLNLVTSFADRKRTLGYRYVTGCRGPRARAAGVETSFTAHEFHYATTIAAEGEPLWHARDAAGVSLGPMGLMNGNVSGSFAHLIDEA